MLRALENFKTAVFPGLPPTWINPSRFGVYESAPFTTGADMCLDEIPADDAGDRLPITDPTSAPGVRAFNDSLRNLKYVPANAAGVKKLRRKLYMAKYAQSERG